MAHGPTLCFSTLGCGELHLEDVIQLAARRNIPLVELRTLGGTHDLPQYFATRYGTPERLRASVAGSTVKIASLDSSVDLVGAGAEERSALSDLLPWAVALAAPSLRVFDGGETGDETELVAMGPLLNWWSAQNSPVTLMTETHDALARPAALQLFIDLYPHAAILWDTHHTWHEGGEAPDATWSRLRGRSIHLHVKDSIPGGAYVPPGAGFYPFDALLATLQRTAFTGIISLEWERHWFPDLPPIDNALDGFLSVFSEVSP